MCSNCEEHNDPIGNEHEGWIWTGNRASKVNTHAEPFMEDARAFTVSITPNEEVRTIDPDTGAMKGRKDVELFTAPPLGLAEYGRVCSYGANGKYAPNNWRLGFTWSLSANALLRHYLAWVGGEDRDPESGLHHLAHAAWHCLTLVQYANDHPEKDDRFGKPADPATGGG